MQLITYTDILLSTVKFRAVATKTFPFINQGALPSLWLVNQSINVNNSYYVKTSYVNIHWAVMLTHTSYINTYQLC